MIDIVCSLFMNCVNPKVEYDTMFEWSTMLIHALLHFPPECTGTSLHFTDPYGGNSDKIVEFYRKHYENCTYVKTNLEIVHIPRKNGISYNLSFFENIREVSV